MASAKLSAATITPSVLSFIGLFGVVVLLAPLYGLLPLNTLLATGGHFSDLGFVECLTANATLISCPDAGLPQGFVLVSGLPMAVIASGFQRVLNSDVVTAENLAGLVFLAVSVPSMWGLLRMLGATSLWALGGTALFFSLPIVYDNPGLGFAMFGYVFLPVCIAATVFHWKLGRPLLTTGLLVIVMTVEMFQTGYVFVMASVFGAIYAVFQVLHRWRIDRRLVVATGAGWALSIVVAVAAYMAYIPGGASYRVVPLEFFRAQGIDLIALVARSTHLYWVRVEWWIHDLNPIQFFAHGEAVRHSYLGLGIAAGILLFLVSTRFWTKPQLASIVLVACVGLGLAMGPSLKINSQRSDTANPREAATYLMPADAAVLELPHAFLYQLWPLNNMRSVSRLYLLFALPAVAMTTLALSRLSSHRRRGAIVVAIILATWIAVEYAPNYSSRARAAARAEASFAHFNTNAVGELRSLLRPSEQVVFVGAGGGHNEYLSLYLCVMADCRTFNASGDKALEIARSGWSIPMRQALAPRLPAEARAALLADLLRERVIDAVVLAHFDMLFDSADWPPPAELTTARSEQASAPYRHVSELSTQEATYFTVVRLAQQDQAIAIHMRRATASP